MKNALKKVAGSIGRSRVLRPLARRLFRRHSNVVYYHLVGDRKPYYHTGSSGPCTVDRFFRDLEELKRLFRFVTLRELCEFNSGGHAVDEPVLSLTFDDGFSLSAPELLEGLDALGIKVTQFLITSCIDNRDLMWRNKLFAVHAMVPASTYVKHYNALAEKAGLEQLTAGGDLLPLSSRWSASGKDELADELWRACDMPPLEEFLEEHRPYFTWDEIRQWSDAGHTMGFHSHTHPYCSRLADDEIEGEIVQPAKDLRNRLGLDFLPFSYPFGDRLPAATERALLDRGIFDCAFGNSGFAPRGTAPNRLERAGIEKGVGWQVFGRSLILSGLTGKATNAGN